jgi:alpha-tubulin suppressor-like RCC1 family protein
VQVGALGTWSTINNGFGSGAAIKIDGTMWAWGANDYGNLGLGNTTVYSSPVQVGAGTTWSSINAAGNHSLAIKTDGTMWSWGYNVSGRLGLGNLTYRSSPVQVGILTNWSKVKTGHSNFSLAIKTDGSLWSWGRNDQGQLGLGNQTDYSSPKQIGAGTTWLTISSTYKSAHAIKTDGTMWAWGVNYEGRLGLGNTTAYSSPKQIGAGTTWSNVEGSRNGSAIAIKTDGTMWSWGGNTNGRLGQGDTANRSSPVQVGALTTWLSITAGGYHMAAIKTNGTLWTWGYNQSGGLGLGDATNRSSPVQIGALTNWLQISAGLNTTLALAPI